MRYCITQFSLMLQQVLVTRLRFSRCLHQDCRFFPCVWENSFFLCVYSGLLKQRTSPPYYESASKCLFFAQVLSDCFPRSASVTGLRIIASVTVLRVSASVSVLRTSVSVPVSRATQIALDGPPYCLRVNACFTCFENYISQSAILQTSQCRFPARIQQWSSIAFSVYCRLPLLSFIVFVVTLLLSSYKNFWLFRVNDYFRVPATITGVRIIASVTTSALTVLYSST